MANDQFPFPFGWYSVELGSYRPCRGTYCCYPYETLPPLEQAFTGTFKWLSPLDEHIYPMRDTWYSSPTDEQRAILERAILARLAQITQDAHQHELDLPAPFLTFMRSAELRQRIPSCTGCYYDLSERLVPCPERDGYIVRFLNDSQSVVTWFLYLSATHAPCVIGTGDPLIYGMILSIFRMTNKNVKQRRNRSWQRRGSVLRPSSPSSTDFGWRTCSGLRCPKSAHSTACRNGIYSSCNPRRQARRCFTRVVLGRARPASSTKLCVVKETRMQEKCGCRQDPLPDAD